MLAIVASATTFKYDFRSKPLSEVLVRIGDDHPEIDIAFIYNQLEDYKVTATVETDNAVEAFRAIIARIPVSMTISGQRFVFEALQEGKFCYRGRAVDDKSEAVPYATVMLLSPVDSTVITYGITGVDGRFEIPCDTRDVIAKLSCIGFMTTYSQLHQFNTGDIEMHLNPVMIGSVTVKADESLLFADKSVFSLKNAIRAPHRQAMICSTAWPSRNSDTAKAMPSKLSAARMWPSISTPYPLRRTT